VLYDELFGTAVRDDWRLMVVEYKPMAVGAFVVAAVLIWDRLRTWKRTRRIETELRKTERKVHILELQESGRLMRLMTELNARSRVKIEHRQTEVEISGRYVAAPVISLPAAAEERENRKSQKSPCSNPVVRGRCCLENQLPTNNIAARPGWSAALCSPDSQLW
jgi:hypothetical protein